MEMIWLLLESLDPGRFFDRIFRAASRTGTGGADGNNAQTLDGGPGFPPPDKT